MSSSSSSDSSSDVSSPSTKANQDKEVNSAGDGADSAQKANLAAMFSSSDSSSDSDSEGEGKAAGAKVNFGSDTSSSSSSESSSSSSEDEADAEPSQQAAAESAADQQAAALLESSSEDEAAAPTKQVSLNPLPYVKNPGMKQVAMARFPNAVAIRTDEFSQDAYDEVEEETFLKKRGKLLAYKSEAIIRWQYALDEHGNRREGPDGKPLRESNARIVEWSDGSRILYIGNQPFDLNLVDVSKQQLFLSTQQSNDFLQVVDAVPFRAVVNTSKAVTDIALSEIRQAGKRKTTSLAHVVTDLEKDQERRAKAVDEAEKQKRREEGKTPKRGKKAAGSIGPGFLEEGATSLGYKRDFVRVTELSDEEDEDDADEEEEEEEESDRGRRAAPKRQRRSMVADTSSSSEESSSESSSSSSSESDD